MSSEAAALGAKWRSYKVTMVKNVTQYNYKFNFNLGAVRKEKHSSFTLMHMENIAYILVLWSHVSWPLYGYLGSSNSKQTLFGWKLLKCQNISSVFIGQNEAYSNKTVAFVSSHVNINHGLNPNNSYVRYLILFLLSIPISLKQTLCKSKHFTKVRHFKIYSPLWRYSEFKNLPVPFWK